MDILRAMAQKVQRDEAHWYGMLTRKGEGGSVKNADPTPRREPDTTGEGGLREDVITWVLGFGN